MSTWVRRWPVPSHSNPDKSYVVAQADDGTWGCSCPQWIFHKGADCKHIQQVKGGEYSSSSPDSPEWGEMVAAEKPAKGGGLPRLKSIKIGERRLRLK